MSLLASPIVWICFGLVWFMNRNSKPKGTNLSVFDAPETSEDGSTVVTTTSGVQIKGASINLAKARSKAEQLVELFDAFFSSESDILAVFKDCNYQDFMLIYDQFGDKHKRTSFGNEGGIGGTGIDLITWIQKEVTTPSNLNKLNKQFPTIF